MKTFKRLAWRNGWLALALVAATLLAYAPTWRAGFIWDDDRYVTQNPLLAAPDGLRRIWFSTDSPSQYFPLVYTVFRLEHALWGLNPLGYHLVNIALHALNALLVWRLLARLRLPGAWLAAAVFALHPVCVESVAWVAELKNVLSLFFSLLAVHAWLRFAFNESFLWRARVPGGRSDDASESDVEVPATSNRPAGTRALQRNWRWTWFLLALAAYTLALFSKTTACTLPAAMVLLLWFKRVPLTVRRLAAIVPFVFLGVAMGVVSVWWERHHQGTVGHAFALGWPERVLLASRAFWFYVGKLLWPNPLIFAYPQWKIEVSDLAAYAWPMFTLAGAAVIVGLRRRVGRGLEVAVSFFGVTLAPMLGFFMLYTFQYKYVADHYQYVACIGLIALVVAGAVAFGTKLKIQPSVRVAIGGLALISLGALTWRQCGMYRDLDTLWRATLARNPDSFLALNNLGELLLREGRVDEAIPCFERTLTLKPDSAQAHCNLGVALRQRGRVQEAEREFATAIRCEAGLAEAFKNLSDICIEQGRMAEARGYAEQAVALAPENAGAQNNLGNALLNEGRVDEAVVHLRRALELDPRFPNALNNLGVACIQLGRMDEAEALFQRTVEILPEFAQAHHNLGQLALRRGDAVAAVARYETSLRIQPYDTDTLCSLAWILATWSDPTIRNGARAVELAERANGLSSGLSPIALGTLAAAYAEAHRFTDAVGAANRALKLAEAQGNVALANTLRRQLKRHEAGEVYRPVATVSAK